MHIKTNNYPDIEYEKGEEIFLAPEEFDGSFYFDVEEELTLDDEAMNKVAEALDEVDTFVISAKDFLKKDSRGRGKRRLRHGIIFHGISQR